MQEKFEKARTGITKVLEEIKAMALTKTVSNARQSLTRLITDKGTFSTILTSKLIPSKEGIPYHLNSDDPEQVAVFKKIINILHNIEQAAAKLEEINLRDDQTLVSFAYQHALDVAKSAYHLMNQVYDVVHLINTSNTSIQAILGPQFDSLGSTLAMIGSQLSALTPSGSKEGAEAQLGSMIGQGISRLPSEYKTVDQMNFNGLSKIIVALPDYLKQLESVMGDGELFPEINDQVTPENYQQQIERNANKLTGNLDDLCVKTGLQQDFALIKIIGQLGHQSTDIINAAALCTQVGYEHAIKKLNQFKHELLPNIIAELETMEENLGLKPGILTEPALAQATSYYSKLLSIVNKIPPAAEKIDIAQNKGDKWYGKIVRRIVADKSTYERIGQLKIDPEISLMKDGAFNERRESLQAERIVSAKKRRHEMTLAKKSAETFFEKMDALNTFYNDGKLSGLSVDNKQALAFQYQQFQPYMAAINPTLDAKIVALLNLSEKEKEQFGKEKPSSSIGMNLLNGAGTIGWYSLLLVKQMAAGTELAPQTPENQFNDILQKQQQIMDALDKDIATETQRIGLIEERIEEVDGLLNTTTLQVPAHSPISNDSPSPLTLVTLSPLGITKKNSLLAQLGRLNLPAQVDSYVQKTLLLYIKNNLSNAALQALNLDGDRKPTLPYTVNKDDPEQVALYKNLINSFQHLENALYTLEQSKDHEFTDDTMARVLFLKDTLAPTGEAICNAVKAINEFKSNPQFSALLNQGLGIVSSLKQSPLLAHFFVDKDSKATEKLAVVDLVAETDRLKELEAKNEGLDISMNAQRPSILNPSRVKASIDGLVDSLDDLRQKTNSPNMASFLNSLSKLRVALNNAAVGSRELILENLQALRAEFSAKILIECDNAEYTFALKPGTLSAQISECFDQFHKGLLDNISGNSDQNYLKILTDTSSLEKRVENEQARLANPSGGAGENKFQGKLIEERLGYMLKLLENEKTQIIPKKIEEFKQSKYKESILNRFREELGPYSEAFYKEEGSFFANIEKNILQNISIEENIEAKISEALQPHFDKLMNEINGKTELSIDNIDQIRSAYQNLRISNFLLQENGGIKVTGNSLTAQISAAKNEELKSFLEHYQLGNDIQEHKKNIDVYNYIITSDNLEKYNAWQKQKVDLKPLMEANPLAKQKFDAISRYESTVIELAKSGSVEEVQLYINQFENKLISAPQIKEYSTQYQQLQNCKNSLNLKSQIGTQMLKIIDGIESAIAQNPQEALKIISEGNKQLEPYQTLMKSHCLIENLITATEANLKGLTSQRDPESDNQLKFAKELKCVIDDPSKNPKERMQTTFTKIEEYEKQIPKPEVTKAKSTYSSIFNTVLHKIKSLVSTTPISDKASESKITEFHDFKNKFKQIMQERKPPLELPVATQESISLRKG